MSPHGEDSYHVPADHGEARFTERQSRFIGYLRPAEDEAQALSFLREIRARHWDASHNVYAYILRVNNLTRFSDDGEPQGTAGLPVLDVLRRAGVFNVCCVVTRYFGGVLLGAGGLVRAYTRAAKDALDNAGLFVMRRWTRVTLRCPYPLFESLRREIAASGGAESSVDYASDIAMTLWLPSPAADTFCVRVKDLSSGQIVPDIGAEEFRAL